MKLSYDITKKLDIKFQNTFYFYLIIITCVVIV